MAAFPNDATYTLGGVTYSMINRRPDRGYQISSQFNTATFTSQIGYTRTRQITRRALRTFSVSYTNVLGTYKQALENFYLARAGGYESFDFDLAYVGQSGTIRVRFEGPISVTQVLTTDNILTDVYSVSLNLTESFT